MTRSDITYERFGKLIALKLDHYGRNSQAYWLCLCDCGKTTITRLSSLRAGKCVSCGCFNGGVRHGMTHTATYHVWEGIKQRCDNPNHAAYKHYGGRGITYDPSWKVFDNFYADMGEVPKGLTLDRINNNGNYNKENCRWTDWKTQRNNQRTRLEVLLSDAMMREIVARFI